MRIDALLWLVLLSCLVGPGDVLARESYADHHSLNRPQNGFVYRQDHYRWRPLNEYEVKPRQTTSSGSYRGREENQSTIYPPAYTDYADTPPGLPRGVYRPVEERHSIVPHMDGYSFRTLDPEEQRRIKRRNERYNESWQPKQREAWSYPSTDGYRYTEPKRQEAYRFRPDKQLEKKRGGNWGRLGPFPYNPAFTDAYQAPMFRPE